MKRIGRSIIQRIREIAYLLVSLPVSVLLFAFAMIGLGSGAVVPLAILIFIFALNAMEYVARFEILRTNKILGTDFKVAPDWFEHPFFSWDGVKERVTSLRAWLAMAYIFVAFGWSIFSFILVIFGLSGIAVTAISLGVITLSNFSRSFEFVDNGDFSRGNISFDGSALRIRLELGDGADGTGILNWDLSSNWIALIALAICILAFLAIPRNARAMAAMTEALLSGTYLPRVEAQIMKLASRRKISEREVSEAMESEPLRPALSNLSNREREILSLMAQGKSNSGIAKSLYITEGAVEKHISNILYKLGLNIEEDSHRRVLAVLKYLGIDAKDEKLDR